VTRHKVKNGAILFNSVRTSAFRMRIDLPDEWF
jgi:hypothetical protein